MVSLLYWATGGGRASQDVLSMWSCRAKLDEEKSKCAGLDQEKSFGSAYIICTVCSGLGERRSTASRKECNKYNLISWSVFRTSPIIMIGPNGLLLIVLHLFALSVSSVSFMVGVAKKVNTIVPWPFLFTVYNITSVWDQRVHQTKGICLLNH